MTVVADGRTQERDSDEVRPDVRRTAEIWSAGVGLALSTILLGGFVLVMNTFDEASFTASGLADNLGLSSEITPAQAYELASTLAAWFGFTLIGVLTLGATGIFAARRRPWRRQTGFWFLAAGLVCLLGSQLILYPVAFAFFVSAGLFALRPVDTRSTT
jgi:hypothetical protein